MVRWPACCGDCGQWSGWLVSSQRPPGSKPGTLPLSYTLVSCACYPWGTRRRLCGAFGYSQLCCWFGRRPGPTWLCGQGAALRSCGAEWHIPLVARRGPFCISLIPRATGIHSACRLPTILRRCGLTLPVVRAEGFEPPTSRPPAACSPMLSYTLVHARPISTRGLWPWLPGLWGVPQGPQPLGLYQRAGLGRFRYPRGFGVLYRIRHPVAL
jgi:hypothetical protein